MSESNEGAYMRLAQVVGSVVAYVANEAVVLARLEEFMSPQPSDLWPSDRSEDLERRLNRLVARMGGTPELMVLADGDEPPVLTAIPRRRCERWSRGLSEIKEICLPCPHVLDRPEYA